MKEKVNNTNWNLAHLYTSDEDEQMQVEMNEMKVAYTAFSAKWKEDPSYLSEAKVLRVALDEFEHLADLYDFTGKVGYYWALRAVQEQSNPKVKEMDTQLSAFSRDLVNLVSFFELNLAKIAPEKQLAFLAAKKLVPYKHYLEQVFKSSKYVLSEAEEKILNLMSQPANEKWLNLRSEFLGKEVRKVLTEKGTFEKKPFGDILSLIASKNQQVRDSAGKQIHAITKKNAPIAEHELNAILLTKKINDELRHVVRADELRHVSDDIDSAVVDTLVSATTERFDISKRYYLLKAKLLGKKKLEYHERTVEMGEVDETYTYDKAIEVVSSVFYELDKEFGDLFVHFVEGGFIDAMPSVGKKTGAACYNVQKSAPTYLYLNFCGKLNDLMTIAHECGHAINNELSKKKVHALDFGTSLATAEVASTFMEDFVLQKVSTGLSDEKRLTLLMAQLDDQIATIFRQIALYNFETELHKIFKEKLYLSSEEIGKLFIKHMSSYMGPGVNMSRGAENWWVYWSHIRRPFYVYSYASGLLISKAMQKKVKADKTFIEKVKDFLSAGESMSPKDIFMNMGIDISAAQFWQDGLTEVEQLVEEAEKLVSRGVNVG